MRSESSFVEQQQATTKRGAVADIAVQSQRVAAIASKCAAQATICHLPFCTLMPNI
jgi:hypothetical protein